MIPVRGFEGKRVAVFGLGRTGLTAARALVAGGAEVALWDEKAAAREAAADHGLAVVDLETADWSQFSALLLSPGVPLTHPEPHWTVTKAKAAGVEVLGDIELFARTINAAPEHKRPKVVIITGTNGKSTTTALIGHICKEAGKDARIGGNIGIGVLGLEDMHGGAVYVLEVSSYQLDLTSSLKPDVAVLLNISPDHLDRHGGMEGYVTAKRRVLLNQGKGDTAVIGVDDPWCQQICTEITAANRRTITPISSGRAIGRGGFAGRRLLVPQRHLGAAGRQGARGGQAGPAQAEHGDPLAFETADGDHWRALPYLSLRVARPTMARTKETIQKRITTVDSFHPSFSKWWWIGAIRKTRL